MTQEDLFGEDYLYFYADDASNVTVRRDVDAILQLLDCPPRSSLLEIGCGEGRLLRELARRGYRVTGVDRSSKMIEAACARAAADAAAVTYLLDDVRNMHVVSRFNGAFSWFTSFGYEDDVGNFEVLRSVHSQLVQGGRFAIDVINRDFVMHNFQSTRVVERNDCFMIDRLSHDVLTNRVRNDRVHIRDGVRRVSFSVRLYGKSELCDLLERAGFVAIESSQTEQLSPDGIATRIQLAATAA